MLFCQENETSSSKSTSSNDSQSSNDINGSDGSDHTQTTPSSVSISDPEAEAQAVAEAVAAKFILKTREEYRIPQSTVTALVKDVDGLYSSAIERAKDTLLAKIAEP